MTKTDALFVGSLRAQAALMDRLSREEKELQEAVLERQWDTLQTKMQQMTETSDELARIEERRNEAFKALLDEYGIDGDFTTFLNSISSELRVQVSDAYRALKVSVLRLKSQTTGIDTYLRATIGTMRGVIRGLYPEHAMPVYTGDGSGTYTGGQALVVNHHQ